MAINSTTFAMPTDGINSNDGSRETDYKSADVLENIIISQKDLISRGGFQIVVKPSYLSLNETALFVVSLSGIPFIVTNSRVASIDFFRDGSGSVAPINYLTSPVNVSNVTYIDFTNSEGDSGIILLNYDSTNKNNYRLFTIFYQNKQIVVTDITNGLNIYEADKEPQQALQYSYIVAPFELENFSVAGGTLDGDGKLLTPPYSVVPSLDRIRVWYASTSKPSVPSGGALDPVTGDVTTPPPGWSLTAPTNLNPNENRYYSYVTGVETGNIVWSSVYLDCVIDRSKIEYPFDVTRVGYYILANVNSGVLTWGPYTEWLSGVPYINSLSTHDGRLIFINKLNNTLYFSQFRSFVFFNGQDINNSLVDYNIGNFLRNSGNIVDVVSSSISGITAQISVGFFVVTNTGEVLSFSGIHPNYPGWQSNGVTQLPSPISSDQAFVAGSGDIVYISSLGPRSLLNSLGAGSYSKINDKLRTLFSSISTSAVSTVTSAVFAYRQSLILIQINQQIYVYNLNTQSWSTMVYKNGGRLFYINGVLFTISTNNQVVSFYNSKLNTDDNFFLSTPGVPGTFRGYVFGISTSGDKPSVPQGGVIIDGVLAVPPVSVENPPSGGWASKEPYEHVNAPGKIFTSLYNVVDGTWGDPVEFYSTSPINGRIRVSYNPIDNNNKTVKLIKNIVFYVYGFEYIVTPKIYVDWGEEAFTLNTYTESSRQSQSNWNAKDWTDSFADITANTLFWNNDELIEELIDNFNIDVGIPVSAYSLELNFSSSGGFTVHNYDVTYEVIREKAN